MKNVPIHRDIFHFKHLSVPGYRVSVFKRRQLITGNLFNTSITLIKMLFLSAY
jgi:hypothetical protein